MENAGLQQASVYTDFQGLDKLRLAAKEKSPEAVKVVAKQFESLFLQMMLKSMRQANLGGGEGIFDSQQTKMYRDMFDKQVALEMSKGQGIGLAKMLVQQLAHGMHLPGSDPGAQKDPAMALPKRSAIHAIQPPTASAKAGKAKSADPVAFDSPEAFVRQLWPQARKAAASLGVAPEALLAQAALETGWGKAVIRGADGHSSYNLFNIKADSRWNGARVAKDTLEFQDGVAVKERAQFRAYGSYAESFKDYVNFLKDNPRYRQALESTASPEAFVGALQDAGYATDPAYAHKIKRIMHSDTMHQTLAALKVPDQRTLS
jgi:flagellar protein FlgJ